MLLIRFDHLCCIFGMGNALVCFSKVYLKAAQMRHALVLCALLALTGMSARADIAYTDPANQGMQAFGGNLALNFNVNSPITVFDLGVFNASGSGTITGTIQVVIF